MRLSMNGAKLMLQKNKANFPYSVINKINHVWELLSVIKDCDIETNNITECILHVNNHLPLHKVKCMYILQNRFWTQNYVFEMSLLHNTGISENGEITLVYNKKYIWYSPNQHLINIVHILNKNAILKERLGYFNSILEKITIRFANNICSIAIRTFPGSITRMIIPPITQLIEPSVTEIIQELQLLQLLLCIVSEDCESNRKNQ